MSSPACGKTLAEYGLVLALVVLVAIAGLTVLGEQLQSFYSENEPVSKADRLFALLDANAGQGASGGDAQQAGSSQAASTAVVNGSGATGSGGATSLTFDSTAFEATSVDGTTRVLSDSLNRIAQTGTLPDGTQVPDDLLLRFQELANRGYALSDAEKKVLNISNASASMDKKGNLKRKDIKKEVGEIIRDKSEEYVDEYESLMRELDRRNETEDIRSIRNYVKDYSRIITNTAREFSKEMKLGGKESISKKDIIGRLGKDEIIEVELAPEITDYSARKIERANEREERERQRLNERQLRDQLRAEQDAARETNP